jgi:hypothetical protein
MPRRCRLGSGVGSVDAVPAVGPGVVAAMQTARAAAV